MKRLPYGYARDGFNIVLHPVNAHHVRTIMRWFCTFHPVQTVKSLEFCKIPTPTGKQNWQVGTLYYLASRAENYYTGIWNGEQLPSILSKEQYDRVIVALQRRRPKNAKKWWITSGLAKCVCGTGLAVSDQSKRGSGIYLYCRNCTARSLYNPIADIIWQEAKTRLKKCANLELLNELSKPVKLIRKRELLQSLLSETEYLTIDLCERTVTFPQF